jgi:hypothetical protein
MAGVLGIPQPMAKENAENFRCAATGRSTDFHDAASGLQRRDDGTKLAAKFLEQHPFPAIADFHPDQSTGAARREGQKVEILVLTDHGHPVSDRVPPDGRVVGFFQPDFPDVLRGMTDAFQ